MSVKQIPTQTSQRGRRSPTCAGGVVVIPAKDDSVDIGRRIGSVPKAGPVIVLDGENSDDTVALEGTAGAKVVVREWHGYGEHKGWAQMRSAGSEVQERLWPPGGRGPGSLFGSNAEPRRALKERVWYWRPLSPTIRFWWPHVVKRGTLDGRRELLFCGLIARYEWLIDPKVLARLFARGERDTAI